MNRNPAPLFTVKSTKSRQPDSRRSFIGKNRHKIESGVRLQDKPPELLTFTPLFGVMLRINAQRAKVAVIFIWVVLAIQLLSGISSFLQYELLTRMASGEFDFDEIYANDTREQAIAILHLALYLLSTVFFIRWFRRAYFNLHLLRRDLQFSEGWAAGAWFVPIVNLFRPYQIMTDLYRGMQDELQKRQLTGADLSLSYVKTWWAVWIGAMVIGQIVFRYALVAENLDELILSTIFQLSISVFQIPLTIVTARVIRNYSEAENVLYDYLVSHREPHRED